MAWRGRGNRRVSDGRRGGFSRPHGGHASRGGSGNRAPAVCRYFLAGKCHYGSSCKYSHEKQETAPDEGSSSVLEATAAESQQVREQYVDFKRQIRRYGIVYDSSLPRGRDCLKIWELVVTIMSSDNRDLHQSVARDLADDDIGGLPFVAKTTQLCTALPIDETSLDVARVFLQAVTHSSLLRSLSIDAFVGTIYRTVGGTNGDRAIALFSSLSERLTEPAEPRKKVLALVVSALYEFLRRERKCLLNDDLPELLDGLEAKAAQLHGLVGTEYAATAYLDAISIHIDTMRRMLDGARGRLTNGKSTVATDSRSVGAVQSTFPLAVVIPGGNHDNDFADISKIQIFPTLGEITSDTAEYLPGTDFTLPHFLADPVRRHLDAAFRLLRHDVFGPLKEVIGSVLAQPDIANGASTSRFISGNIKAHSYGRASIQHIFIDNGLQAILSFARPPQLRKHAAAEQRRWWDESSRLEKGNLVCFVSTVGDERSFLVLVVTKKSTKESGENKNESSLVSDRLNPAVTARLASETQSNMAILSRMYVEKQEGLLIELPGLIPETFVPILENLQCMMRDGHLAFQRWILPSTNPRGGEAPTQVPPPAYARRPGFRFSLRTITQSGHPPLSVNPSAPDDSIKSDTLEAATGLDNGQSQSLLAALTREYALIQGPPGTGKSYVGVQLVRVLLDHKIQARLGPILVICYTNHALDQFLKHLLDVGIHKIIRIGGQSRAEELGGKNLRVVSRDVPKTTVENRILGQNYSELDDCLENAGHRMKPLHQARKSRLNWDSLRHFLLQHHPTIASQFQDQVQDGFTLVGGDPRWALAESWIRQITQIQSDKIFEFVEEAKGYRERINGVHDDVNRRALQQADVVGVTTTGLARNIKMLRRVGPKVIICEEAAEVLEPHVISALMPGVEHFIQIGDHKQLRPQIQNYLKFSVETAVGRAYQLDRSQFERRAVGEPGLSPLPVAQLNVQRRMRPEISQLIRRVYPNLQDHDCVSNLPLVVGMRDNLFWLTHNNPEDSRDDGSQVKSHSNPWEVAMAAALIRHLIRQGEYKATDIALLTPYTGQLQKLRAALSKHFEVFVSDRDLETLAKEGFESKVEEEESAAAGAGPRKATEKKQLVNTIRLATVDNFQGEEAKVIVVSLVRSNNNRKVGFLRTENRINVLLSRAQHGMYLIGNAETYQHVPMWADVHRQLSERGAVGTSIGLLCPRHPDTPFLCSEPGDFTIKSPEGGCALICDKRLEPCGHKCPAPCHSQRLHDAFDCMQPCPRIRLPCQHPCPKLCGQGCGPCIVKIDGVQLPCGHVLDRVECHRTLDLSTVRCSRKVDKIVPGCGHTVSVPCHTDVASKLFRCSTTCTENLECGHQCPGTCGRCRKEDDGGKVSFKHQQCSTPCGRAYGTCNHRCSKPCHEGMGCGTCSETCEVRCPHSRCNQACQKACTPCIEKCTWSCEHEGACSLPCAAPCNRLPCDRRCPNQLKCGHQCPSFCGEECPHDLCQICCTRKDQRVDLMEFKTYGEIDLEDTPIAVLGCGHFFTGETLDGLVGMASVYTADKFGKYIGLQELSGEFTPIPACPDCRVPIRQFATRRYNRVVNKAVLDETSKRFLVDGRERLAILEKGVTEVETELSQMRKTMIAAYLHLRTSTPERHKSAIVLDKETAKLRKEMDAQHQPTKRLFDAVMTFQRHDREQASLEHRINNMHISDGTTASLPVPAAVPQPVYDRQITLNAHRLQLRIQEAMLRDTFTLLSKYNDPLMPLLSLPGGSPLKRSARFLQQCEDLITSATDAKLPRLVIPTILAYARVVQLEEWYRRAVASANPQEQDADRSSATNTTKTNTDTDTNQQQRTKQDKRTATDRARHLLADALALCDSFPTGGGGQEQEDPECSYRGEVEETMRLFDGPRYETVTPEEIAAIKSAMVAGPGGIATHSGHWYTCRNGHPFAIGECGMPMQLARCPECGEAIGGQNHVTTDGTQRDLGMERA
ncbi:hypothetical protein N658DRAFT_426189 [Parathielavia hyrcaniae]|uniref:NFX1-type zinc finger-containing protein 1 n=1 Tax=Parathielavia hyrcaniae TaxID=113614 RepID=A0AAN6Q2P5_9PEZI|nr:hypothetical protein N658DRAFT_426189 [Parathielavia hyrcaniae]